jgi:hypothetical protein
LSKERLSCARPFIPNGTVHTGRASGYWPRGEEPSNRRGEAA